MEVFPPGALKSRWLCLPRQLPNWKLWNVFFCGLQVPFKKVRIWAAAELQSKGFAVMCRNVLRLSPSSNDTLPSFKVE